MYHPAAALHAASMRHTIEQDFFRKLPAVLEEARKGPKETAPEPQQMRLF